MGNEKIIQIIESYTNLLERVRESAEKRREGDGMRVHCLYLDDERNIKVGYFYMGTLYDEDFIINL